MHLEYYYCLLYDLKLAVFLDERRIPYKVLHEGETFSDGRPVPVYLQFRLRGHSELVDELAGKFRCSPLVEAVYSVKEMDDAPLLWMTPAKQTVDIINGNEAYLFGCEWVDSRGVSRAHHKEQIGAFKIRKEPSGKGRTAIWAESTGFSAVFVDSRVKSLSEAEGFSGLEFRPVMLKNGMQSQSIFQLSTPNRMDTDSIVLGKGEKELSCPMCGKKQYGISEAYQLHLDLRGKSIESDLYMTERIFGWGIATPLYLVSQRFYRALRKNKLSSGVSFDPVAIR